MAMASFLMVQDEIGSGQLHAPYGFARDGSAYYLLSPVPLEQNEKYARFHTWLMKEVSLCLSGIEEPC